MLVALLVLLVALVVGCAPAPGPPGPPGPAGAPGEDGEPGEDGTDGAAGVELYLAVATTIVQPGDPLEVETVATCAPADMVVAGGCHAALPDGDAHGVVITEASPIKANGWRCGWRFESLPAVPFAVEALAACIAEPEH